MAKDSKPTFERPVRGAAHQQLIDREDALAAAAREAGQDPYRRIVADRLVRWAEHALITKARAIWHQWAGTMVARYGAPTVRIWHVNVDWITALAIARYGEAEDCWPEVFTELDERRAVQWFHGLWVPEGVKFAAGGTALGRPQLSLTPREAPDVR